jgi:hypothetical protein
LAVAALVLHVLLDRAVTHACADEFQNGDLNLLLAGMLNSDSELAAPWFLGPDLHEVGKHFGIVAEDSVSDLSHGQVHVAGLRIADCHFHLE